MASWLRGALGFERPSGAASRAASAPLLGLRDGPGFGPAGSSFTAGGGETEEDIAAARIRNNPM
jgi:hypothetical protein